jgi:uncharacterized glyoxalase superfamily protein PhnB
MGWQPAAHRVQLGNRLEDRGQSHFRGQCREAFEFHAKVLDGKIVAAHRYSEAPPDMPATMMSRTLRWRMH